MANGDCICDPFENGDCSWQHYVSRNCPASCSGCSGGSGSGGGEGGSSSGGTTGVIDGCVIDCSQGQYWPHPTNCEMFIQCTSYGPQEMPCGEGTRWDQELLTCNHEYSTSCVTGEYQDGDGKPCGGSSGSGGGSSGGNSGGGSGGNGGGGSSGGGSGGNGGGGSSGIIDGCVIDCSQGQYWTHPTNCEMFIQCTSYGPQEMPCGKGTRWDQELLTCNHEYSTSCVTGEYQDEDGKACGGSSGSGGGSSGGGSGGNGGSSGGGSGGNGGGGSSGNYKWMCYRLQPRSILASSHKL